LQVVTHGISERVAPDLSPHAMFMLEFFFNMGDATLARAREGALPKA
jgi:hypothetical protein